MAEKVILSCPLCPGDVLTLTAAVESLHATYPGEYLTDVRSPVPAVWEQNPHITPIDDRDAEARRIDMQYPAINRSNQVLIPFLSGYTTYLGSQIDRPLGLTTNRPHLYLSDEEKEWINQVRDQVTNGRDVPYWLVSAGTKSDYTLKQWPVENYQQVVNRTRGRIQWVQIGESGHNHPDLDGVIDLRGKTDTRQLIRLAYHAAGGLGPVTFLQHIMAAFEKPYLCLLGGREPVPWVTYSKQTTFHTIGALGCCRNGGCWKARVVPLDDGDESKNGSLCEQPVIGLKRPVGRCMALIDSESIIRTLGIYD